MNRCLLCGSHDSARRHARPDGDAIMACRACGVEWYWPQPDDAYRDGLYSRDYYQSWGDIRGNTALRGMKRRTADFYLRSIVRHCRGGRLLDVGCAAGYFLESARERGFAPFGIEYAQFSAAVAREKFGSEAVETGTLETTRFPDGSFDVITMIDLLEHVTDPAAALTRARKLIKPGGIIVVVTPDTDALTNTIMGRRWTHYKKEHLYYFNRRSLGFLAGRAGLDVRSYGHGLKYITLEYVCNQYRVYRHRLLTPVSAFLNRVLPRQLLTVPIPFKMGEAVAVLAPRP